MSHLISGATAPLDICWDKHGIPHIFAQSTEDAYRGLGYACASERLWQLHLSNLYATGTSAAVMGERFVTQDLVHHAFNVPAFDIPESPGDGIVDAYLQGVNAWVKQLDNVPAEFRKAGCEPREYTRHDVASRYRFTGWFQHKTWLEKIWLGKLMAKYGVDRFKNHVLRFSDADANCIAELSDELEAIDLSVARLLFPFESRLSGSNNWAISAELSASGAPMLATDPHQPHSIPNTFFYAHLSAPGFDAFGASFPGVPYFMMGFNQHVAWGLTTGFVDTYDVFVERDPVLSQRQLEIDVAGGDSHKFSISQSRHGPILESITAALGFSAAAAGPGTTALDWVMQTRPTSAGALALLPLAKSSAAFGDSLFENEVCPLVNNIICVDRGNDMRRFIAATIRKRPGHGKPGVTGVVPLPGWQSEYDFATSTAAELLVESNPERGFTFTANNDTMGNRGEFPIHNFPTHDARARRIEQLLLEKGTGFTVADFASMQLDLKDLRAEELLPALVDALAGADPEDEDLALASKLLSSWDAVASLDSKAACIFYPLIEQRQHIRFMQIALGGDDLLIETLPAVAPGLNRFSINDFTQPGSAWLEQKAVLEQLIRQDVKTVLAILREQYGDDWNWGKIHQIRFGHSLRKHAQWQHMQVGLDPIAGSPTTLAMAMHNPPASNSVAQEVFHGPAFRWIVDMADPLHFKFTIAGGNGGRVDSPYLANLYPGWRDGNLVDVSLIRNELEIDVTHTISPT